MGVRGWRGSGPRLHKVNCDICGQRKQGWACGVGGGLIRKPPGTIPIARGLGKAGEIDLPKPTTYVRPSFWFPLREIMGGEERGGGV